MVRILFVLRSFAMLAGTERVVSNKLNWLANHGYEVALVTYEQGSHPMAYELHPSIRVTDLDVRFFTTNRLPLYQRYIAYRRMKRLFRQRLQQVVDDFRPDIIMTTTYSLKIADEILKVRGGTHLVMESHETCSTVMKAYDYRSRPLMRMVAQWYDRQYYQIVDRFDQLVTLTAGDAAEWQRHIKVPVSVIPNPLMYYPSTLSDKPATGHRFISVGRLERVKGFDRLITAFARIAEQCEDWCLDIYGQGSEEVALRAQIAQYGLEQRILIHQPTPHIYDAYQQSDCYVLTSRHEGFGMVLLEAMSCGLPCVAFDCPYGPGEVIKNGETGWLVRNDDVEQLAERLLWVATHDDERQQLGETARQQVLQYQNDAVMQQWTNLFSTWS